IGRTQFIIKRFNLKRFCGGWWQINGFEVEGFQIRNHRKPHVKLVGTKCPHAGVVRILEREVSSSSSDHGSRLRGAFENSPTVASGTELNITKLNLKTSNLIVEI
ncbi:hypothetical protein AVEN_2096-1, partial [Araneus ventricosus]